jgi:hypothetical protein
LKIDSLRAEYASEGRESIEKEKEVFFAIDQHCAADNIFHIFLSNEKFCNNSFHGFIREDHFQSSLTNRCHKFLCDNLKMRII